MRLDKKISAGAAMVCGILLSARAASAEGGITVIPDGSVVWQMVNFIVLVVVLDFVLYKPIRTVVARRKEKMEGLDNNIEAFTQDAADKERAWNEGIKKARARGVDEKNALIEAAAGEEKKIMDEIYRQSQKALAQTREEIARDAARAAEALQREIDEFAAAIGSKILGRDVA
ncbi:MAG: ATPase [Thermodesulfobacteriota bacterium]|nr:ATPase [Thermodesulfobacteriota bacterium]